MQVAILSARTGWHTDELCRALAARGHIGCTLPYEGLLATIRREASLARTGLGFAPSLVVELDDDPVPDGASIAADRFDGRIAAALADDVVAVVREGLANAARHAHASSVGVRVAVTGAAPFGEVLVEVVDDGQGLAENRERRSGTANLEARARQHRGTSELGPAGDEGGTRLVWRAPLTEAG